MSHDYFHNRCALGSIPQLDVEPGVVPFDVSLASLWKSYSSGQNYQFGVSMSNDGTKLMITDYDENKIRRYSLSTPYDVSTAGYDQYKDIGSLPTGSYFRPDGLKYYVVCRGDKTVKEYTLSTAWDLSTMSLTSSITPTQEPYGVCLSSDGTKMYISGNTASYVYQYNLSTAWSISSANYANKSFGFSAQASNVPGLTISTNGAKMYLANVGSPLAVYQYTLSTPFDVSTASYDSKSITVSGSNGIWIYPELHKMVTTASNSGVYIYTY